jgi:catechol 2,3-dioxygenase-like lactoylglutathione lyase family enzyme
MRIDHIAMNAVNLEDEISFFVGFLGFSLFQKWETPRQAYVGMEDGPVIGLIENKHSDGSAHTMAHLALEVPEDDFDDWVARVHSAGFDVVSGPKEQRGGRTILFRTPGRNIIELCYPRVRTTIERGSY